MYSGCAGRILKASRPLDRPVQTIIHVTNQNGDPMKIAVSCQMPISIALFCDGDGTRRGRAVPYPIGLLKSARARPASGSLAVGQGLVPSHSGGPALRR